MLPLRRVGSGSRSHSEKREGRITSTLGGIRGRTKKLDPPRAVWIMLPAGAVTEGMIDAMSELLKTRSKMSEAGVKPSAASSATGFAVRL
jgi:6-phosphogluconate dehydrogenase (decarboxylating)